MRISELGSQLGQLIQNESNSLIWFCLSTIIGICVIFLVTTSFKPVKKGKYKKRNKLGLERIPGPQPLPFIGNVHQVMKAEDEMLEFFLWIKATFAHRTRFRVFGRNYVCLYTASDIQKVLQNKKYLDKSVEYSVFSWIGDGALTATGHRWLITRPVLDQAFHLKALNKYKSVFYTKTLQLVDTLLNVSQISESEPIDVFHLIVHCGFDIICETLMNTKYNCLGGVSDKQYSYKLDRAADYFHYRQWRHILYTNVVGRLLWRISPSGREEASCLKWMNNFSEKLIQDRRQARESERLKTGTCDNVCLLDILLDAQEKDTKAFTDIQIRNEVDTFLTGGHGATTASTGLLLQMMASHPEIQEKAYQELKEIFGEDTRRHLTPEDFSKMNYLGCCIKESLRLFPGVPIFPRELKTDLELNDGVIVDKGTNILIMPFILHRDPEVFPDPDSFIPERFTREESAKRHPYAYIPFSAGPRNCIGKNFSYLEMKYFLAYILIHFKIEKVVEMKDVGLLLRIFLKPKNGIKLRLIPR